MARADLIVNLVKASSKGDKDLYRQTLEAIIAEERSKHHHGLADKLSSFLVAPLKQAAPVEFDEVFDLIYEKPVNIKLDELYLTDEVRSQIDEVIEEHHRADLLRSYDLEPRHRLLLVGPPGNGKTSTAEAVSEALMVPMYVVRYENLIGSYLGETAQRIKKVVDFVKQRRCVLFFDEFDAVSKERGDNHETGEIKRVVNSLLLQLDSLPSHVTLISASNHSELLDRAVWRRFQVKLELKVPTPSQVKAWISDFTKNNDLSVVLTPSQLSVFNGLSFSEIKDFGLDVLRRVALTQPKADAKKIVANRINWLKQSKKLS